GGLGGGVRPRHEDVRLSASRARDAFVREKISRLVRDDVDAELLRRSPFALADFSRCERAPAEPPRDRALFLRVVVLKQLRFQARIIENFGSELDIDGMLVELRGVSRHP